MSKGEETRRSILRQALDLSSEVGLEGLTFGALARRVGLSKSGLYAHFTSKEDLQGKVLDTAAERFVDAVLSKVLKQPRGLPRVNALYDFWIRWAIKDFSGGCPFMAAATEFDDRHGQVRDRLVGHLRDVLGTIARAAEIAVEEGHFRADLDVQQFSFDFYANLLALHHHARLGLCDDPRALADRGYSNLIKDAKAT